MPVLVVSAAAAPTRWPRARPANCNVVLVDGVHGRIGSGNCPATSPRGSRGELHDQALALLGSSRNVLALPSVYAVIVPLVRNRRRRGRNRLDDLVDSVAGVVEYEAARSRRVPPTRSRPNRCGAQPHDAATKSEAVAGRAAPASLKVPPARAFLCSCCRRSRPAARNHRSRG